MYWLGMISIGNGRERIYNRAMNVDVLDKRSNKDLLGLCLDG